MKKRAFVTAILFLFSIVVAAQVAQADEPMLANIPFAFVAGNVTLPAGEYKFKFNNPAYLRGGRLGTMSFDTQDFPWGDYARKIYVIIRNNWYDRPPYAFREGGMKGYVCWRFVIERNGTVSQILSVRSSQIPPYDLAALNAIRASSPLPPLPEDFPEPREGVTFCFFYNMSSAEAE